MVRSSGQTGKELAKGLGPREIARRRLAGQRLIGAPFASPVEVVRRLGAVQSQDYSGGKWGIALRTSRATNVDVERALTDCAIVRTHVLRPTWHFVAAEDIRWMLALTAPRVRAAMTSSDRKLELDTKIFSRSAKAITKALVGGRQLSRAELRQVLQRARIGTIHTQRLGHLMLRAELDGLVCSGVTRDKQTTYALLEERVPNTRPMQRDEALAELATRYFTTRGPATVHDFSWWSGLTVGDARKGVEAIQSRLDHAAVDGRTYWFADNAPGANTATASAHLLPNYDEYFIGLKDRSAHYGSLRKLSAGVPHDSIFTNVIVADGQVVGAWKRSLTGRSVTLHLRLVVPLTARQRQSIESQAQRYAEFLALPVEISHNEHTNARRRVP